MTVHTRIEGSTDALPRSTRGKLSFAIKTDQKPYTYAYDPGEGNKRAFGPSEEVEVEVANIRERAGDISLDVEGFQLVKHKTAVRDFWDEAQTLALGHPEAAEIVKQATGAKRVVVFDHTLRRRQDGTADRTKGEPRQPAARVHVDQTVASGPQRVRDLMGDEAEALLAGRAAIINVWRPINQVARDWPLAFADARSVAPEDLVGSDLIFPHRRGEIYMVAHNPGQRWGYVPDLGPDEAVLLKCWDSDPSVAQFAPHTGFEDPTTPSGTPPRESIEFRTIAFFA